MEVVRSDRKTVALQLLPDLTLRLKAPRRITEAELLDILEQKRPWIEKHLRAAEARQAAAGSVEKLSYAELQALAEEALRVIPERVRHFAPLVGVSYGRITIRNQRSRWGSCSSKGNLNFNCLLMLAPPEVVDSVVVHELCHRKEMNHSPRFYAEVYRVFPEYDRWNRQLLRGERLPRVDARPAGEERAGGEYPGRARAAEKHAERARA